MSQLALGLGYLSSHIKPMTSSQDFRNALHDEKLLESLISNAEVGSILEAFWDVSQPSPFYKYALHRIFSSGDEAAQQEILENASTYARYAAKIGDLDILSYMAPELDDTDWADVLQIALDNGDVMTFDYAFSHMDPAFFTWSSMESIDDYHARMSTIIDTMTESKYVEELKQIRDEYEPVTVKVSLWENRAELAMNLHTELPLLDLVLDRIRRGENYLETKKTESANEVKNLLRTNPAIFLGNDRDLHGVELWQYPPATVLILVEGAVLYRFSPHDFEALQEDMANPYSGKMLTAEDISGIETIATVLRSKNIERILTLEETLETLLGSELPPRIKGIGKVKFTLTPAERLVDLLQPYTWSLDDILNTETGLHEIQYRLYEEYKIPPFMAKDYDELWMKLYTYLTRNPHMKSVISEWLGGVL